MTQSSSEASSSEASSSEAASSEAASVGGASANAPSNRATAACVPVLSVQGLHAGYDKHRVLIDVNVTITRGEWFALLGPNASGKTTLLHCVAGMLAPTAGNVLISGHDLRTDTSAAKSRLGFGSAPERLPKLLTGRQCLEVYAAAKGLRSIDADVLALAEEFRYTPMLDLFVDSCSLGTRQKLAVLLALLGEPDLILFDEAFNGLDPASSLILKRHLRERVSSGRCGVLLATHALDIVERYADRAALLLDGDIVHEWRKEELRAMRALPEGGFEAAVASVSISHANA
jgi:ABC-2 type transport system ATP-binding protein